MSATPRARRALHELRTVRLEKSVAPYAEGSCLVGFGNTRVLCTASVQESLPEWRKGARAGWVTAEYAMLPRATQKRTPRERGQVGGRTQEIQRLVGRALRACMDLEALGERSIVLDCDVLSADGGTRTAAITGAAVALHQACTLLVTKGAVARHPMNELVAAVSVGVVGGEVRMDLEYIEDVNADVDLNLVALESGRMVEIQGTAEHSPFNRAELDQMVDMGMRGIHALLDLQRAALAG